MHWNGVLRWTEMTFSSSTSTTWLWRCCSNMVWLLSPLHCDWNNAAGTRTLALTDTNPFLQRSDFWIKGEIFTPLNCIVQRGSCIFSCIFSPSGCEPFLIYREFWFSLSGMSSWAACTEHANEVDGEWWDGPVYYHYGRRFWGLEKKGWGIRDDCHQILSKWIWDELGSELHNKHSIINILTCPSYCWAQWDSDISSMNTQRVDYVVYTVFNVCTINT